MPNCWAWQIATNLNISNSIETAVDHIRILEALETIKNWRTKKKNGIKINVNLIEQVKKKKTP